MRRVREVHWRVGVRGSEGWMEDRLKSVVFVRTGGKMPGGPGEVPVPQVPATIPEIVKYRGTVGHLRVIARRSGRRNTERVIYKKKWLWVMRTNLGIRALQVGVGQVRTPSLASATSGPGPTIAQYPSSSWRVPQGSGHEAIANLFCGSWPDGFRTHTLFARSPGLVSSELPGISTS